MPQGNPFTSSNRCQMNSNYLTDINQGGGEKKAGFPYQIGREWYTSVIMNNCNPIKGRSCCTLKSYNTLLFPLASQTRPIGSRYSIAGSYWHIPGTGN
jgi:hypothetical protein